MIDLRSFTHLSFDCYGTLIDWETGILEAVGRALDGRGLTADPVDILRGYARHEAEQEAGPYKPYRDVLRGVMAGLARDLGFEPAGADLDALADSVGDWPPFADTVDALNSLKSRYKLAIISNIDDDFFGQTAARLGVEFDEVITAQQVRQYKPSPQNFRHALERLGVPASQLLHVAQSLYHDHVPAKAMGLSTAWVNRPSRCPGTGVSLPADARPDLEVPDLASLATMAAEA